MPSKSEKQRRFFFEVLRAKVGKTSSEKAKEAAKKMTLSQISDFTKRKLF